MSHVLVNPKKGTSLQEEDYDDPAIEALDRIENEQLHRTCAIAGLSTGIVGLAVFAVGLCFVVRGFLL